MDIQEIVAGIGSTDALNQAADQAGLDPGQAQDALHGVLEHFTNGGSLEDVAESVAGRCGIAPDQVQAFLPQVLPLLQGSLRKRFGRRPERAGRGDQFDVRRGAGRPGEGPLRRKLASREVGWARGAVPRAGRPRSLAAPQLFCER
ncbi:MAG: hypothetical protein WDM85_02215 [Caulobacteraceae bacterium]